MAGDYRVRFQGDLGNLAQFSQSVRGAFTQIRSAYRSNASAPVQNIGVPNLQTGKLTTQIDAYNRTLIQSGQVFHRYVSGWTADIARLQVAERKLGAGGTAFNSPRGLTSYGTSLNSRGQAGAYARDFRPVYEEFYTGEYKTVSADLDKVEEAQRRLIPATRAFANLQKQIDVQTTNYEIKRNTAAERGIELMTKRYSLESRYNSLIGIGGGTRTFLRTSEAEIAKVARARNAAGNLYFPPIVTPTGTTDSLQQARDALAREAATGVANPTLQRAIASARGLPAIEAEIKAVEKGQTKIERLLARIDRQEQAMIQRMDARRAALLRRFRPELQGLERALNSTPPIPRDLDYFLSRSKDFRKQFAQNLQVQTPYSATDPRIREQFSKELLAKGITPDTIEVYRDLEKGVYRVSGQIKDANGITGRWTATLDDNMRKVERWGGSLRGSGGFLRQTVRDFQKVIEWTVATTAVFGTLGLAFGSLSKINEVNANLARFSITAQTSAEETKTAFNDITNIAIATATPLGDLVAVMDDIALATRRANQTASEWRASMNSLAEAVGILTNLTGVDTVRATDLLSSAYKQLNILPQQLIPLLNKVTAVAGGNAQAIEDIISALGGVSEAAKAAGLTVDEQIAAVQTLSQVTNKSAADVATAFKNLFGSLSSKGATDALAKFGIETRDATGELRGFLDIYKEIYDARQAGRISEGQLADVLRGIAGGPRRAPDAAALLANIPLIFEQLDKAAGASNEALIANARILDTNSAKLQQIRTQFDATLVNQFSEAVNKLVKLFYDLGTAVNDLFGGNASGLLGVTLQLGLMAVAIGLATKGWGLFRRTIGLTAKDLTALINTTKQGAVLSGLGAPQIVRQGNLPPIPGLVRRGSGATQRYQPNPNPAVRASGVPRGTTIIPYGANIAQQGLAYGQYGLNRFRGSTVGRLGLLAGAGVAAGAALNNFGGANGAALGQGLGLLLLTLGGPVGIAAGGALTAISTGFQLMNDEQQKAVERSKNLRNAVYDNIKVLTEERNALGNAQKAMDDSKATIDELRAKKELDADETERLKTAQKTYVDSIFAVSDANAAVLETTSKLITQIPQLEDKFKSLSATASGGILSPEGLQQLSAALSGEILGISGIPNLNRQPLVNNPPKLTVSRAVGPGTEIIPVKRENLPNGGEGIRTSAEVVKAINEGGFAYVQKLLDTSKAPNPFDEVRKPFELDQSVLDAISLAFSDVQDKGSPEFVAAVEQFGKWVQLVASPQSQLNTYIQGSLAEIQAKASTGVIRGERATNLLARAQVAENLRQYLPTLSEQQNTYLSTPRGAQDIDFNPKQQFDRIYNYIYGKGGLLDQSPTGNLTVSIEQAREYIRLMQDINPAYKDLIEGTDEFDAAAYQAFSRAGIEVEGLKGAADRLGDTFEELGNSIQDSIASGVQNYTQKLLGLRAERPELVRNLRGARTKDEKITATNALEDNSRQIGQTRELAEAYQRLGDAFQANKPALESFKEELNKIHGLQGIAKVDTDQLLPTLINYAEQLGLTGKQVDNFTDKLIALLNVTKQIDGIKAQFNIRGNYDIAGLKAYLQALLLTYQASATAHQNAARDGRSSAGSYQISGTISSIQAALRALGGAENYTRAIGTTIRTGGGGGGSRTSGGGGGGGGGSTRTRIRPDLLDIPDEFHESSRSVSSLLKEAIKNARSLQRKIPGETKENRRDIVELLDGTKRVLEVRGIGEDYLRRAMDELAAQIKRQNDLLSKADTIRRIRVGAGDFAAIANVPVNSRTGVSFGGANGPINITLNLNGTVMTPAQLSQFADLIGFSIKRQLAG